MDIFKRVVRIVTYVFLTFCLVGLIFCSVSSDKVVIASYTIHSDKVSDDYTCLVISDYHHRSLKCENGNIVDIIKKQGEVDSVIFTGDLIDSHSKSLDDVNKLFNAAKEISDERYFVTGNHEAYAPLWNDLNQAMLEKGVVNLDDKKQLSTDNVYFYGLQDARFKVGDASFKKRENAIKESLDQFTTRDPSKFNVLLMHRPENFKMISANYDFDLMISGHTHGGQFKLGSWVPAKIALEEGEFIGGKYHRNNTDLIVSRGLGYSAMFPLRVNCNPEIVKITISK